MSKIRELKEKRARIFEQMKEIQGRSAKEGRAKMSDDESRQWDAHDADFNNLTADIEREEKLETRTRQMAAEKIDQIEDRGKNPGAAGGDKAAEYREAFGEYLRHGELSMSAEKRQALKEFRGTATQVTTTAALGGYAVPQDFSQELEKYMILWGGMEAACRVVNTSGGNLLPWPTVTDTANSGARIGEGVADVTLDIPFSVVNLSAYTYTSKNVKISKELVQDSAFNLQSLVAELLAERVGRITNSELTTGTGSSQPNGIVTASTLGKTAASATTFTAIELLDLIHSVDPSYRLSPSAGFMLNDGTLKIIKQLTIGGGSDTRPLWVPSMREGAPDTIWGFKYHINQNMAAVATAAKAVIFGDFSKYIIRKAGAPELVVMNERFADERVIAFNLFSRYDGNLVNTAAVKHLVQA